MSRPGARAAWGSLLAGLASCVTLPLAVYLTRFSDSYDLLHAGVAIPVAVGLALVALGIVGLCMAASALIALGVYGLLEYVGSRD